MKALKHTVFALAPTVLVMAVLEGTLAVLGVGDRTQDVWRGFDSSSAYLVPDAETEGAWRTQIHEGRGTRKKNFVIPPKSSRTRVTLFGGSNTQGFGSVYLDKLLNEGEPPDAPRFEVVNLGRNGYGSARVATLFEQTLVVEPDIVVIYCGHNEFQEASLRLDLEAAYTGLSAPLAGAASHLRSFNALVKAFAPDLERTTKKPEEWNAEYVKFRDTTYDQTQVRMAHYQDNLRHMIEVALDAQVTVVLGTVAGNLLAAPYISNPPADFPAADAARLAALQARADELIPPCLEGLVKVPIPDRLHFRDWRSPQRQKPRDLAPDFALPELRRYGPPFEQRVGWWVAPGHWDPKVLPHLRRLAALHRREVSAEDKLVLEELRSVVERMLELLPDHPEAHYRLALTLWLLGDDGRRTAEHLRLAARYDRAPLKASDLSNDLVRELAAEFPEVILWDVDALVRDAAPDGIVGYELFQDMCHFHGAAVAKVMESLCEVLLEATR